MKQNFNLLPKNLLRFYILGVSQKTVGEYHKYSLSKSWHQNKSIFLFLAFLWKNISWEFTRTGNLYYYKSAFIAPDK